MLVLVLLAVLYLVKRPAWVTTAAVDFKISVNHDLLQKHVKKLSHELKSRSFEAGDGLNQASDYIESELKQHHDRVSTQPYQVNGMTFQNVIATHGPNDAPITVVGAHYDAYGGLPGADDNASGVAGLLELNRLMANEVKAGLILNKQIILVAYTLEEPPIYASNGMGSVIHAESLRDKQVELMISLEMIGYFNDQPDSQHYPVSVLGWVYPNSGHFITVVDELFSTAGAKLKKTFNQQGLIETKGVSTL